MTTNQINTLRKLILAMFKEYWNTRQKLTKMRDDEKFEKACKENAHLLTRYMYISDMLKNVEKEAAKVGLQFNTVGEVSFQKYCPQNDEVLAVESELTAIKAKLEERLIRLELASEGADAMKVFNELCEMLKL